MGAALDMARGRGMLGEEHETSGRMFDQKGAGLHNYDDDDEDKDSTFKLQERSSYLQPTIASLSVKEMDCLRLLASIVQTSPSRHDVYVPAMPRAES